MAYETPLKIADVMKEISNNRYVLPAIQREFVWNTNQIEKLFDSILSISREMTIQWPSLTASRG